MSSWIRRQFDGIGLTQSPPGPHLGALQARFGGTVLLCIDVSASMSGPPLRQAVRGGQQFLDEAFAAHYRCGLVLWSVEVETFVPPGAHEPDIRDALAQAETVGSTDIAAALELSRKVFRRLTGDRVVCIFGDGDVGDHKRAVRLARELCAMGVRIVVRGLGTGAAAALAELTCPGEQDNRQLVETVDDISVGIASMATGLSARRRR